MLKYILLLTILLLAALIAAATDPSLQPRDNHLKLKRVFVSAQAQKHDDEAKEDDETSLRIRDHTHKGDGKNSLHLAPADKDGDESSIFFTSSTKGHTSLSIEKRGAAAGGDFSLSSVSPLPLPLLNNYLGQEATAAAAEEEADGSERAQVLAEEREEERKMEEMEMFLATVEPMSLKLKSSTMLRCDIDEKKYGRAEGFKVAWTKLKTRRAQHSTRANLISSDSNTSSKVSWSKNTLAPQALDKAKGKHDEIQLISLDHKVIAHKEGRFQVSQLSPYTWFLTIKPIELQDNDAYFLCQIFNTSSHGAHHHQPGTGTGIPMGPSSGGGFSAPPPEVGAYSPSTSKFIKASPPPARRKKERFIKGVKISVLVPPQIVESETSAGVVVAHEGKRLLLRCQTESKPESRVEWRRLDGKSLEELSATRGVTQTLRHLRPSMTPGMMANELLTTSELISSEHSEPSLDNDINELLFHSFPRQMSGIYLCNAFNGVQPGVSKQIEVRLKDCGKHKNELCPLFNKTFSSPSLASGSSSNATNVTQHSHKTGDFNSEQDVSLMTADERGSDAEADDAHHLTSPLSISETNTTNNQQHKQNNTRAGQSSQQNTDKSSQAAVSKNKRRYQISSSSTLNSKRIVVGGGTSRRHQTSGGGDQSVEQSAASNCGFSSLLVSPPASSWPILLLLLLLLLQFSNQH